MALKFLVWWTTITHHGGLGQRCKLIHFCPTFQVPPTIAHCKHKPQFRKSIKFCVFGYKYWLNYLPAIQKLIFSSILCSYLAHFSAKLPKEEKKKHSKKIPYILGNEPLLL